MTFALGFLCYLAGMITVAVLMAFAEHLDASHRRAETSLADAFEAARRER